MKKSIRSSFFLILLASLWLVACSANSQQSKTGIAEDTIVLEVVGMEETKTFTMSDLKALPSIEGWGGTVSSAGVITVPQRLVGVDLVDLADQVGGLQEGMGVSIVAKDGYSMTMSYEQIVEGDFITYDPGSGIEKQVDETPKVIVAYERDGEPISSDDDGPLRLFIITSQNNQIVDGHWTVKWVNQIRLKPMSEEWSLQLEGARSETMDRNSFESCSAPGCHQATWTDETDNIWTGVPLYYLAGRVDDGVIHEDRAYNDDFAKAGYTLELFAADGYSVSIDSQESDFNRHILVASLVNGEPLEEENFPLRFVGEGLEKKEMVGQLVQIILQPNEGIAMPSGEAPIALDAEQPAVLVLPDGAALMVVGNVLNKLTLGLENLGAMNVVEVEAEHPKTGLQTFRGVVLTDLLNLAGVQSMEGTLVMIASDGYQVEIGIPAVMDCQECLLSINEDGTLSMAMVGLESNYWVKDINFLEVR